MGLLSRLGKLKIKKSLLFSTNLFILALPLFIAPLSIEEKNVETMAKTELRLSLNDSSAVGVVSSKPEIQPGESTEQKIAREKAEAEAEAKQKRLAQINRNVVAREMRVYNDPSNFDQIYAQAGSRFGVDASILKAIHIAETGASGSTSRANPSGAQGPMQFLPSTWKRHAVDGNGDGYADINNVEDAIFSAAEYLRACGYPDVRKALWGYNPSTRYVNKILNMAQGFGFSG